MRIADVKTHVLEAKLSEPFAWSFNSTAMRGACLVEIVCEDGTIGWGECFGPAALNAAIVAAFRPHLVGADPLASDRIWMHLYDRFRDQGQRGPHRHGALRRRRGAVGHQGQALRRAGARADGRADPHGGPRLRHRHLPARQRRSAGLHRR